MDKEKNIKEASEEDKVETYSGLGTDVFLFKKSDLKFDEDGTLIIPSDVIRVHLDKDKKPLTSPEPLTVKADYSSRAVTADSWLIDVPDNFGRRNRFTQGPAFILTGFEDAHYNATKLASSVLPVSSISPFRVEMHNNRLPFWTPVTFKRNIYNIGHLGIPSPEAFRSPVHSDSIAGPKNI